MTEARIPLPRRFARTPVVRQPSAASALGQALSGAGQALGEFERADRETEERIAEIDHRIAMEEQKRQDDALFIEKAEEWAHLQAEATAHMAQLREEAEPFAHEHAAKAQNWLDEHFRAFDEGIENERVRQRFRPQIVNTATTFDLREQEWERQKSLKAQGDAAETAVETYANELARGAPETSAEDYQRYVDHVFELIDAGAVNADEAAAMRRMIIPRLARGRANGLLNARQPQALLTLIDEGWFDDKGVDITALRKQALAVAGTMAREAEIAEDKVRDDLRDRIAGVRELIKAGATDVGADLLTDLQAQALGVGLDPKELVELDKWSIELEVNKRYTTTGDLNRGIRALERHRAEGKLDPAGQIQLRHMRDRRETLLKELGEGFSEVWAQGGQSRQLVVNDLFAMPAADRVEAANALDKSGALGRAVRLSKGMAGLAVAGAEARKADKELVPENTVDVADQRRIFDDVSRGALAEYSVKSQMEVLDLARDIYAGMMQHTGKRDFDENQFAQAVQSALGRRDGRGGVATWHGNGVLLPDWISWQEFGRKLNGFDFANAAEPANIARRKYTPVLISDDGEIARWRFRDESGEWLGRKGGGFYETIMRKAED